MSAGRVIHITIPKSGSQWVRDVLGAPEIAMYSGFPLSGKSASFSVDINFDAPPHTFSGPIYYLTGLEWLSWRKPGDKAVVVLRDPRDCLISLMFSALYSHENDPFINGLRNNLLSLPSNAQRIERLMSAVANPRFYRSWHTATYDDALVVKYETLIANQHTEFRRIIKWLGWAVPDEVVDAVVDRLSFKSRSGRTPGEADKFSHYRRGVAGDWRNHFSRESGRVWEQRQPGFLVAIGYEHNNDWWEGLPDLQEATESPEGKPGENTLLAGEMTEALMRRNQILEKQLAEKEAEIQVLSKACAERLALIEHLDSKLKGNP